MSFFKSTMLSMGIGFMMISCGPTQSDIPAEEESSSTALADIFHSGLADNGKNDLAIQSIDPHIGQAVVNAAKKLAQAKTRFCSPWYMRFNPSFWELYKGDHYIVKEGQSPSAALLDIFNNKAFTPCHECSTAIIIIFYRAILDLIGNEHFDRVFDQSDIRKKLIIGPMAYGRISNYITSIGAGNRRATSSQAANFKPGSYGYVRNWSHYNSESTYDDGWQGENIIFLGDGFVFGHPFGIEKLSTVIDGVDSHRREGFDDPAGLTSFNSWLNSGIYQLK